MHQPPVLFLDEPTTGIDVASARQIRQLLGWPQPERDDHLPDHALHRGGRAALRPHRLHRVRADRGPGRRGQPPAGGQGPARHRAAARRGAGHCLRRDLRGLSWPPVPGHRAQTPPHLHKPPQPFSALALPGRAGRAGLRGPGPPAVPGGGLCPGDQDRGGRDAEGAGEAGGGGMTTWIAFWHILWKDARTYYLKPPNVSSGIALPSGVDRDVLH
ncbi:MAG: hypothetical protein MZV70_30170 [Desulfobacterales bacterium]|nr:hypothetical protein [Desulfobacterales bacterium]